MTQKIDDFQAEISLSGGAAMLNLWRIQLPSLGYFDTRSLNLLCRSTSTPGRSINGTELMMGLVRKQIANGYGVTTIPMTFIVLNDAKILNYFETWQSQAINQYTYETGYYKDYVYDIKIDVLKKGYAQSLFKKQFNIPKLPSSIKNRLPTIGPINFRQGEVDLQLLQDDQRIWTYKLIDAYPSAVTGVNLTNDPASGFMEINVEFTFRDWRSTDQDQGAAEGDVFGKSIDKLKNKLLDKLGF